MNVKKTKSSKEIILKITMSMTIRSWMCAHGIPIHIPSTPSNAVIVPDVRPAVQGEFLFDVHMTLYLPNHQTSLPKPHDLLHMYRRNRAYLMFESTRI